MERVGLSGSFFLIWVSNVKKILFKGRKLDLILSWITHINAV